MAALSVIDDRPNHEAHTGVPARTLNARPLRVNSPGMRGEVRMLLNVQEAAKFLAIKPSTIRAYVLHQKIPHYKIGGSVRFSEDDLRNYLAGCRREPLGRGAA
jgi:excisionase family DNA binding protein